MTAQKGIDDLRAKQGIPNSIDPNFHADTLQEVYNGNNYKDMEVL